MLGIYHSFQIYIIYRMKMNALKLQRRFCVITEDYYAHVIKSRFDQIKFDESHKEKAPWP